MPPLNTPNIYRRRMPFGENNSGKNCENKPIFTREPPERSRRRSGGGVRAGMHRGKPLIPQSCDDSTRQPAPNVRPERPVRARRRALPANLRTARSAVRDGGQVERRQPRNLDHGTQDRGAGCRCPGRSAARERGGVGLGVGVSLHNTPVM